MFEFASNRPFLVLKYANGFGRLLLVNPFKNQYETGTRVEILFSDVIAMDIRMFFDGLSIREVDSSQIGNFASRPKEICEFGMRFYELKSPSWSGYVFRARVDLYEETFPPGEFPFKKPSHFWQAFETPQEWEARVQSERLKK